MALKRRNERDLEAKVDWALRLQGAEDARILLARPLRPDWTLRPSEDASISPGETIIVCLAASFERYWAESIRTFVAETSSFAEIKDEKANKLYRQIMAFLTPGKAVSQFYKETMDGFRGEDARTMPDYGLGHGIGLGLEEPPLLDEKDPNQLTEEMCLVLRIAIQDKERGALMTGNTVSLSSTGVEVLTI
jgi:Xaa-Pro aminopeptidase